MNTTTSNTQDRLTAEDIANLDIEELLRNIFGPDVPLKEVLKEGLEKVEHTEKMTKKMLRDHQRAEKRAARRVRAAENAEVRAQQLNLGVHVVAAGAMGACAAAKVGNPYLFAGLAVTGAIRAARAARDLRLAINVRDALRNGDVVVEADTQEAIRAALGEARFNAVLALLDAGMLAGLGFGGKDPVWALLAGLDLFIAMNEGAKWNRFGQALAMDEMAKVKAQAQAAPKTGAKKTTPPRRTSAAKKAGAHKAVKASV